MLTKKISHKVLQISILLIAIFASCKKNTQNITSSQTMEKANSLTKIFSNRYNLDELSKDAQASKIQSAFTVITGSYSITTGCSSNTLNLTDLIIITSRPIISGGYYVKINGIVFYPTFVNHVAFQFHYQLLNVSLSSIGVSDFCQATTLTLEHYIGNTLNDSETLPINEGVSCGTGSYQCSASSPGTGQLSFYLPYLACGCANMYPPIYTFEYRLQGTSAWTTVPISYPTYFSTHTVPGLSSGIYEVYGQNTCSTNQSPYFVPSITTTVTVP